MNRIDVDYQNLLKDILENGVKKSDRTGTGTLSVFGRQIRHKMSDGYPLLTTKKMAYKSMIVELLWFLRGDTNIKYLVDNNCHIWDGDAYKAYKIGIHKIQEENGFKGYEHLTKESFIEKIKTDDEFAKKWGELGPIYGKQWRDWKDTNSIDSDYLKGVDQIQKLIDDLKTNSDSRRLMVSAWNVSEIENMVLPPCHYGFQCYTRELTHEERYKLLIEKWYENLDISEVELTKEVIESDFIKYNVPTRGLSLQWNQRSVDTGLGLPFNIASYGLLLTIIAKNVNMMPDELIGNLGDTHIYLDQVEDIKVQLDREPYDLPNIRISDKIVNDISEYELSDFTLENYESHPAIKLKLSN